MTKIIQKPLLGQTISLMWNKKNHKSRWLIGYKKSSFWFWKNYFFTENKGSYDLLIDRIDLRFRLYRLRFLGLSKILDYQPFVQNVSIHSLEQDIGLPDLLVKPTNSKIQRISILNKQEKLNAKPNISGIKLKMTTIKLQLWKM